MAFQSLKTRPPANSLRTATLRGVISGAAGLALIACLASPTLHGQQSESPPAVTSSVDMSDPKAVEQRADLYMVRKFFPEAVGLYSRLITLDPKNALYQNKLGIAYHQMQDFNSAKRAYRAALRLDPKYAQATNNLAAVEYAQKNYRSAILTYLKALELSPGDAVVYSNLGTAYFAYKKYEYAMTCYKYALMRDPTIFERTGRSGSIVHQREVEDMATFNFYLAKTYAEMGNTDQTLIYIVKAYEAGYKDLRKSLSDKVFAFLATEPRFIEFVARMDADEQKASSGGSTP